MKVIWEVEDGYVGKSRPQEIIIPDDEIYDWEGKISEEEKQKLIEDCVQEDFNQKISWAIVRIEE